MYKLYIAPFQTIICDQVMRNLTGNRKGRLAILVVLCLAVQIGYLPNAFAQESPVSGVMVFATNPGGSNYNVTAVNGKYIINQGLPTGNYEVSTFAEGYISQRLDLVNVVAGSETGNINFSLKRSGGISGKVTDSSTGAGIANVQVTAYNIKGWFSQTDSNGNYRIITNLESGTYNVTVVSAAGFNTKTVSGVSVTAGVETTGVNISLSRSSVISGKVRTPSGVPVTGVIVTAMSSDGGSYQGTATTGLDGSYRIESGLGAGNFTVTAFSGTSFDQVQNVIVSAGHETPNVDLTLNVTAQPSGAISGIVTDANNNPIAGATISAGSGQDTSDSNGAYMISSGIPTGTYTVTASAPGYQQQDRASISVTSGSTTPGINFKLVKNPVAQSGRISGTVTGEDNPLTNKQPSSITCVPSQASVNLGTTLSVSGAITPPLAGLSIKIEYKTGSTAISRSATTGGDGKYSDNYAPTIAGSWTVQATWAGDTQHTGASSVAASFTVTQPPPTTGNIKITVLDSSAKPIVGAAVSSTTTPSGQAKLNSVSGSDGSVSFSGVALGPYTIQATMTGYEANTGSVNVVAGGTATSSITLQTQTSGGGNPSSGIPSYPYEAIITGVLLGAIALLWMRRRP